MLSHGGPLARAVAAGSGDLGCIAFVPFITLDRTTEVFDGSTALVDPSACLPVVVVEKRLSARSFHCLSCDRR